MLVRILSNIASVLGNARSRAVLASCFVMLLATSSVVGILAMHEDIDRSAASSNTETDKNTKQRDTIWLNERAEEVESVDNQDVEGAEQERSDDSSRKDTSEHAKNTDTSNRTSVEQPTPELAVNVDSVSLTTGTSSETVSVTIDGDNQNNTWMLTLENNNEANGLTVTEVSTNNNTLTFRVQADKSIKPGTYQVKINAVRDQDNATILYQTLTISVTEKQ